MSNLEIDALKDIRRHLYESLQRHGLLKEATFAAGVLTLAGGALTWIVRYSPPPPPLSA